MFSSVCVGIYMFDVYIFIVSMCVHLMCICVCVYMYSSVCAWGFGCMYCVLVCGHMLLCVCIWVCMLRYYKPSPVMHLQFYPEAREWVSEWPVEFSKLRNRIFVSVAGQGNCSQMPTEGWFGLVRLTTVARISHLPIMIKSQTKQTTKQCQKKPKTL